jgi:ketosteroid isomerase-like protein
MKKILIAICVAGILFSCKQTLTPIAVVKAPIDSLISNYNKAWNNHDSTAIQNLFASDALLIDDDIIAINANEINTKWIRPYHLNISNATTIKMQEWSSNERAGFTGNWILDMKIKKGVIKVKGTYTMIWTKNDKGEWKITTADLHSAPEK